MARKPFVVVYPDGSKKNVGTAYRNSLLLNGEISLRDGSTYEYVG